ncbi:MAG TPA: SufE family protein [Aggregatilinea sp.]|uniref:SufE family protein n=1 Tax=Aggregatilinea sp. TaxID=2806333 RepID=UPI002CF7E877|nr:SufE family protein [Aggregatilinea sp.]HML20102.1 SufE family protein [Aggregatilinea sp.]
MSEYPEKLKDVLDDFGFVTDRSERAELLMDYASRFEPVPARIAESPYPEDHRVPFCESEAYVWSEPEADGALKYFFAVENPQGLSAMAMAVILDETLSGAPIEKVAQVSQDIVLQIFGREISMGKGQGLMGMVSVVQAEAKRHLAEQD